MANFLVRAIRSEFKRGRALHLASINFVHIRAELGFAIKQESLTASLIRAIQFERRNALGGGIC